MWQLRDWFKAHPNIVVSLSIHAFLYPDGNNPEHRQMQDQLQAVIMDFKTVIFTHGEVVDKAAFTVGGWCRCVARLSPRSMHSAPQAPAYSLSMTTSTTFQYFIFAHFPALQLVLTHSDQHGSAGRLHGLEGRPLQRVKNFSSCDCQLSLACCSASLVLQMRNERMMLQSME